MTKRSTWGRILGDVESKLEQIANQGDSNVVTMPQSLDALAKEIRETSNAIVDNEAEHEKLMRKLSMQHHRMVEHIRALGIKADVIPMIAAAADKGAAE